VKQLHREFVRCGSDSLCSFTYYAHREKMELVGKGDLVTDLNRRAVEIAYEVQQEFVGVVDPLDVPLVAGNICNSTLYRPHDPENDELIKSQYREQVSLFKEYAVDYIIAETFEYLAEAVLALEVIQEFKLPAVMTMSTLFADGITKDGFSPAHACDSLKRHGAEVVGLNCSRGPDTMMPLLKDVKRTLGDGADVHVAGLPVCYQTSREFPTMQAFGNMDEKYLVLDCHTCTRADLFGFARDCMDLGIDYIGTCCGGAPHHIRAMAEAVGKETIASKYSADLSAHFMFGDRSVHERLRDDFLENRAECGKHDTMY